MGIHENLRHPCSCPAVDASRPWNASTTVYSWQHDVPRFTDTTQPLTFSSDTQKHPRYLTDHISKCSHRSTRSTTKRHNAHIWRVSIHLLTQGESLGGPSSRRLNACKSICPAALAWKFAFSAA